MEYLRRSDAAKLASEKTLVGFGAGIFGARTQRILDGVIEFFVDNEEKKWNHPWEGEVPVYSPESLKKYESASLAIIICAEQYETVAQQLKELAPNAQLLLTPLLKDYNIFEKLNKSSTQLLVSAYGATGGLYLVNTQEENYTLLKKGSYRGQLTLGERHFLASEEGELFELTSIDPLETVSRYKAESLAQTHGLAYWDKENLIIIAEAQYDRITFIDADTFQVIKYLPVNKNSNFTYGDNYHINDMSVYDDTLFVSMLSSSGFWRSGVYDGCILAFDLHTLNNLGTLMSDLLFPHSITKTDNTFYILESLSGKLISSKKQTLIHLGGYLRGLCISKDLIYIGQSRHRLLEGATQYMPAISIDSGVYVVDLKTKINKFIKMPDMCDVYNIIDLN